MNRRLPPRVSLLLLGLALTVLVPGCGGKKKPNLPPERERTGARAAYHHTREILSFGPRPPESEALDSTRNYIVLELEKCGWQSRSQTFEEDVDYFGRTVKFSNLTARFGSADEATLWDKPVKGVLGAHMDSKYYQGRNFVGADDAASAVGVILELARELQSSPKLATQLELVFFDGEESFGQNISPSDGLYGSKEYALRWRTSPRKPEFGIVLDMIGHKNLKIRYPGDTPPFLEDALLTAARRQGEAARYAKALNPIIDDHVPLNDAGIPTIDIIGDFSQFAWWHTDADNLRLISRDSLAITLKVTRGLLNSLLGEQGAGSD
ncbi:MAG: M28 family peptidase [Roseibacillus sp.]